MAVGNIPGFQLKHYYTFNNLSFGPNINCFGHIGVVGPHPVCRAELLKTPQLPKQDC